MVVNYQSKKDEYNPLSVMGLELQKMRSLSTDGQRCSQLRKVLRSSRSRKETRHAKRENSLMA